MMRWLEMTTGAWVFAALGLVVLGLAWWKGWDRDDGGSYDAAGKWTPWPDYYFAPGSHQVAPDKVQHSGISHVLTLAAGIVMAPATAGLLVFALGVGWELQQMLPRTRVYVGVGTNARTKRRGKFSWRDLVADAAGCAMGVVVLTLIRMAIHWGRT